MPYVLDTSFLIDLEHGHLPAVATLHELTESAGPLLIPTPALVEFLAGLEDPDESATHIASGSEVRAFSEADAHAAARLASTNLRKGRFPGWSDAMIAGFALHHRGIVVTANPSHFVGVETRTY